MYNPLASLIFKIFVYFQYFNSAFEFDFLAHLFQFEQFHTCLLSLESIYLFTLAFYLNSIFPFLEMMDKL
ncbi:MAG: hypothetical protein ACK55Z_35615, partial [bacterium]